MRPEVFGTPIVLPPDAGTVGRYTMSSLSVRQLFEQYELNVYEKSIMNPPDELNLVFESSNAACANTFAELALSNDALACVSTVDAKLNADCAKVFAEVASSFIAFETVAPTGYFNFL